MIVFAIQTSVIDLRRYSLELSKRVALHNGITACYMNKNPERENPHVRFWDALFTQAAAEGISAFVASGDAASAGCGRCRK